MITQHIPCYAWTPGEPHTYQQEVEFDELIPYEESYEDVQKIRKAMDTMDAQKDRYVKTKGGHCSW